MGVFVIVLLAALMASWMAWIGNRRIRACRMELEIVGYGGYEN